jgi:hypothetical protein
MTPSTPSIKNLQTPQGLTKASCPLENVQIHTKVHINSFKSIIVDPNSYALFMERNIKS